MKEAWEKIAVQDRMAVEAALKNYLPEPAERDPARLVKEAMGYSLHSGGKRVRPLLALAFCRLCGGTEAQAMPFACSVEMIHTYSLIHDDMPCMDDDDLRRGLPTNHMVFGEAMALLAGDGLLTLAFETALRYPGGAEIAVEGTRLLSRLAGASGMVGGQCVDLTTEEQEATLEVLEAMDLGKTVALIQAACQLGCLAAGATKGLVEAAGEYARGIGLAFQIRDDVLDVLGDKEKLGKNTGMDSVHAKQNYVSLLGVEKAQALVTTYTEHALKALGFFPGDTGFLRDFGISLARREM